MREFKIRCSAISQIMSEPRTKAAKEAGELSSTTKSYVHEWLTGEIYKVNKDLDTKHINKGLIMEDRAIEVLQELYNSQYFMVKNEAFYSNDFIQGTPDVVTRDTIFDTKCSWDMYTFPLFQDQLNKVYWWQMQGYMALTGKMRAVVAYVLVNTPEHLRYSELDSYEYESLPTTKRVKEFNVDFDPKAVKEIEKRVIQIREYIKQLLNN